MKLTDEERHLLVLSLRVAAERYEANARSVANIKVSEIFRKQASQTYHLADRIEEDEE